MDTLGDAEPLDIEDAGSSVWGARPYEADDVDDGQDIDYPPRPPLVSSEAWAVTSLSLAVASLFITGVAQFAAFVLAGPLGLTDNSRPTRQFLVFIGPTGVLALAAAAAGYRVWRRRDTVEPWAGAIGTAGLVVGGLITLLVGVALVMSLVLDPSTPGQV